MIFKKPLIVIIGDDFSIFSLVINKILDRFKLIKLRLDKIDKLKKFSRKNPVLIIDYVETLKNASEIKNLLKNIRAQTYLVLNYDDERIRELKSLAVYSLTYGFQKKADIYVSDIFTDDKGMNFKINYRGSSIPFWFGQTLTRKQIYNLLAGIAVGLIKDLNLVEMSQVLKKSPV